MTDEDVTSWNRQQKTWTGIDLTPEQTISILEESGQIDDLCSQALSMGFDTEEREWFIDILMTHLLGQEWPTRITVMDKFFMPMLREEAKKRGYKVLEEDK